jgi:hypothetical protein
MLASKLLARVLPLVAVAAVSAPASAVELTTDVYAHHGIPGTDVDTALAIDLPVDVAVKQGDDFILCLDNFLFTETAGPVPLAWGTYDIGVNLDLNDDIPCETNLADVGTALLSLLGANVSGASLSVIAHLTEPGGIALSAFANDVSPLDPGKARIELRHTAAVVPVDATVQRGNSKRQKWVFGNIANGASTGPADVRPGDYTVRLAPAGTGVTAVGPVVLTLPEPYVGHFYFAVGSLDSGTFDLIELVIPGL